MFRVQIFRRVERDKNLFVRKHQCWLFAKCTASEGKNEHNSCNHNLIGIVPFFSAACPSPASSMKFHFTFVF